MVFQKNTFLNRLHWIFPVLTVFYIALFVWFHRAVFLEKLDMTYWQDRYEQSQWKLPSSKRIIGDVGLYQLEGHYVIEGKDPSLDNPEVPPFGKYLIGLSIKIFGNAAFYGLITTCSALFLFWVFSYLVTGSAFFANIGMFLVATDPLITEQLSAPMMDSLQLVFILGMACTLFLLRKKSFQRGIWLWFVFGALMGLFASVKIPILLPLVVVEVIIGLKQYIWSDKKIIWKILFLIFGFLSMYMGVYARYFMLGHTLLDWIGLQKGMLVFFLESGLGANFASSLTTLCCNSYQNLFTRTWTRPELWSWSWLLVTVVVFLWSMMRKKSYIPFALWSILTLLLYTVIPFWVRYLVIVLPIFYCIAVVWVKERGWKKSSIIIVVLVLGIANIHASSKIIILTPEASVTQFINDWSNGFFQDMYERMPKERREAYTRADFHRLGQQFWYEGQIEKAQGSIRSLSYDFFQKRGQVDLEMTYMTRSLGTFTEPMRLGLVLEDGQWLIDWGWDNYVNGLTPSDHLKTIVDQGRRGTIIGSKGEYLAYDIPSLMVSVVPARVDTSKEEELLELLQKLFGHMIAKTRFHDRYVINTQQDWEIPIGVIPIPVTDEETSGIIQNLRQFPGMTFKPSFARTPSLVTKDVSNTLYSECCSLLYSTTSYDGVKGQEKEYNEKLKGYDGGTLVLVDSLGNIKRVLIEKTRQDGQNIMLSP